MHSGSHLGRVWQFLSELTYPCHTITQRSWKLCPHKIQHTDVSSRFLHNYQTWKQLMSFSKWWTDKQPVVHPDNGCWTVRAWGKRASYRATERRGGTLNASYQVTEANLKSTYCTIPTIWHSGKGDSQKLSDCQAGVGDSGREEVGRERRGCFRAVRTLGRTYTSTSEPYGGPRTLGDCDMPM